MPGKIFINYRRGDDPGFTQALFLKLEEAFASEQLFMDVDNIPAGIDFVQYLDDQVSNCDVLLAVIGPKWLEVVDSRGARRLDQPDDFVRIEIASALRQEKRVVPVLVNNAKMPRDDELPDELRPLSRRHAVRLTHERFKPDAEGLIRQINTALDEAEAARQRIADAARQVSAETERQRAAERQEAHEAARREAEEAERRRQEEARLKAIAGLSPEQIAKAEELANWDFIKDSARAQDFRDHLARFPKGVAERMARAKLEKLVWIEISEGGDAKALEAFLQEFPDGSNTAAARSRLAAIEATAAEAVRLESERRDEAAAWTSALESNNVEALEAFVRNWPGTTYASKAKARIKELQKTRRLEKPSARFPLLAIAFFLGSAPACIVMGLVFKALEIRFFLIPGLEPGTAGSNALVNLAYISGFTTMVIVVVVAASSVIVARRRTIRGVEALLYGLGGGVALIGLAVIDRRIVPFTIPIVIGGVATALMGAIRREHAT